MPPPSALAGFVCAPATCHSHPPCACFPAGIGAYTLCDGLSVSLTAISVSAPWLAKAWREAKLSPFRGSIKQLWDALPAEERKDRHAMQVRWLRQGSRCRCC